MNKPVGKDLQIQQQSSIGDYNLTNQSIIMKVSLKSTWFNIFTPWVNTQFFHDATAQFKMSPSGSSSSPEDDDDINESKHHNSLHPTRR